VIRLYYTENFLTMENSDYRAQLFLSKQKFD